MKFDFTSPVSENGYCGYPKIALYGIPTPNTVAINQTNITLQLVANQLKLGWPGDHTGWRSQVQTNDLNAGPGTNWSDVAGSVNTNQMSFQ